MSLTEHRVFGNELGLVYNESTSFSGARSVFDQCSRLVCTGESANSEIFSKITGADGGSSNGVPARSSVYDTASDVAATARHSGQMRVMVTLDCMKTLAPWFNTAMYERGVSMDRVISRKVVTMDASLTGWGALCDGRSACGTWTSTQKKWHINCLELKAVFLALQHFLPMIKIRHVLIRTDNTTMVTSKPGAVLPSLGGQKPFVCAGSVCSRQSELRRGQAVQGKPSARRMEAAPVDDSADLESVRGSGDGLVCLRGERALPDVLLADKRSPRWGRTLELLAPGVQICFSSSKNHAAGAAQDQRAARDCVAGGAEMANQP